MEGEKWVALFFKMEIFSPWKSAFDINFLCNSTTEENLKVHNPLDHQAGSENDKISPYIKINRVWH